MARFIHALILFTVLTFILINSSLKAVIQTALLQSPNFSAAILKQGQWEEVMDFMEQVPLKKFAYIFLTQDTTHVRVALMGVVNLLLIFAWLLQWICFSTCSREELRAARESFLYFSILRLIFFGSILDAGGAADVTVGSPIQSTTNSTAADGTVMAPLVFQAGSGSIREGCTWLLFFSIIAFVRWFLVLLRERFQTAQASPHATMKTFVKYLCITIAFSVFNLVLAAAIYFLLHNHTSWRIMFLLLFENAVILMSSIKVMFKYILYIRTLQKGQPWEERGSSLYYSDMSCEIVVHSITIVRLLDIWHDYGFNLSFTDIYLFLHMRQLVLNVYYNIQSIRKYRAAIAEINNRFPDASEEELRQIDDVCSICRDSMERAKKLPCGHLFHKTCIISWIEHQSACPTCRAPLIPRNAAPGNAAAPNNINNNNNNNIINNNNNNRGVGAPNNPAGGIAAGIAGGAISAQAAQIRNTIVHQQNRPPILQQMQDANNNNNTNALDDYPGLVAQRQQFGLRNRFSNSQSSNAATVGHDGSALSPHNDGAHSHSHSHGHSHHDPNNAMPHGHSHTITPLFHFDTQATPLRNILPNFSFQVQSIREAPIAPLTVEQIRAAAAAANVQLYSPAMNNDQPPPLEPLPTLTSSEVAASAAASSSPAAATMTSPAASMESVTDSAPSSSSAAATAATAVTTPTPTLREKIYLATQRRLEQENAARDPNSVNATPSTTLSPSSFSSSSSSAIPPSTTDVSNEASSMMPEPETPSPPPTLPALQPVTTSPQLLSQADADANLARELQMEEQMLALEEERNRRNARGTFAGFFGAY